MTRLATIIALALLAGCGQQERPNDALERQWLEQQLERQAEAAADAERLREARRKSAEDRERWLEENPMYGRPQQSAADPTRKSKDTNQ